MTERTPYRVGGFERHAEVVRSMIEAENRLVNDRMAWLTTLEGLLFAALAFVWDKPNAVALTQVLCVLGVVTSAVILSTLVTASMAQRGLLQWWDGHRPKYYDGPDVIGWRPSRLRFAKYVAPWSVIAIAFIGAWVVVWVMRTG